MWGQCLANSRPMLLRSSASNITRPRMVPNDHDPEYPVLFLVVDGGASGVRALITAVSRSSRVGSSHDMVLTQYRASGDSCNAKNLTTSVLVDRILRTIYKALGQIPLLKSRYDLEGLLSTFPTVPYLDTKLFEKVWLGIAGIQPFELGADRASSSSKFQYEIRNALSMSPQDDLRITNDGHLLVAKSILASSPLDLPHIESTIIHVAGTGSISMAFRHGHASSDDPNNNFPELLSVAGGWGYLIGDEGSAYTIGKISLRYLLQHYEERNNSISSTESIPTLFLDLLAHFKCSSPSELIEIVYSSKSEPLKIAFAESARIALSYAFVLEKEITSKQIATEIIQEAIEPLVDKTILLVKRHQLNPEMTTLSLGGGLWNWKEYKDLLVEGLKFRGFDFTNVLVVNDPLKDGSQVLINEWVRPLDK